MTAPAPAAELRCGPDGCALPIAHRGACPHSPEGVLHPLIAEARAAAQAVRETNTR